MPYRYFYDCEFIEDGRTVDLVSIGVVDEFGREFYAVSTEFDDSRAVPWVRRNVLDKLPKSMQPNAHKDLREIWLSPNRGAAEAAMTTFAEKYAPKYDKAVECLIKDRQTLLMFFDLPADHWDHLRTSNPIESVFATVRHRTVRMKGALSQDTARLMVFKLVMAASRTWRRLQGQNQLPKVVNGIKFKDGIEAVAEIKSAA